MEERIVKMTITKPGGNASKNAKAYRVTIPPLWAKHIGITEDNRTISISLLDENKIMIEKIKE